MRKWHHLGVSRLGGIAMVVVAIAFASCNSSLQRHDASPAAAPEPTSVVGKALQPTTAPPVVNTVPLFVVTLEDQNGLHPAGIPVRITGPAGRSFLSDGHGRVTVHGSPGVYGVEVVRGCHEKVLVTGGASTQVHTTAGATAMGTLKVVWQHRVAPAPPTFANVSGGWPVGGEVEVTYTATDRCNESPVPNGEYPTFEFQTSANLKVVGRPLLKADADGRGRVTLSCTRAGDVDLVIVDRANPSDRTDLASSLIEYAGPPHCID
jgi:hypothetical protein